MENARLRECLGSDFARLREMVVGLEADAQVPSCPEWTVADLTAHVGAVYLHKVACMRTGTEPDPWPPAGLADEAAATPLALVDRGYGDLTHEFDTRPPEAPAGGWYAPDRTVGFLIRRMAQEAVMHRLDAEIAAGVPAAPVPADLAVDGIDEFLYRFLEYGTVAWLESAREVLAGTDGGAVRLSTTGEAWLVRPTPEGVQVSSAGSEAGLASVSATPTDLLCWLWGRAGDDRVTITGDAERVAQLRAILTFIAQ
jgi:uncharacterized protein (TIGR03083 family)